MKVPPKRKGNAVVLWVVWGILLTLNESPSEKEGKLERRLSDPEPYISLNESPSEKEGKSPTMTSAATIL